MTFDFNAIPGLIVWLETDRDGIHDRLREQGIRNNDQFIWQDPNDSRQGVVVIYDHPLSDDEVQTVQCAIVERYNDDSLLPDGSSRE